MIRMLRPTSFDSLVIAACLTLWPESSHAELYSYVDDQGTVHFTNIDPGGSKAPLPESARENTFSWTDDLGTMRRVHRVDVQRYDPIIQEAAEYYDLPPSFVKAVIAAESSFEPTAVSPAGAQGLMQLIPSTAQAMMVRDVFSPRDNVFGGTRYLRLMANRFKGDIRLTLAAYNAGPTAVERVNRVPRIPETQTYVRRVLKLYHHYLREQKTDSPS